MPATCFNSAITMAEVVEMRPLPNVELPGLAILGSIPVQGNELFASAELSALDAESMLRPNDLQSKQILISPQGILPGKLLPSLGAPKQGKLTQP
jgi:hypothetical protein